MKQLKFDLYKGKHGGRRPGSGRKRIHSKGVAHRSREKVLSRTPVHVNFKYNTYIKKKFCLKLLKRAIVNGRKFGLKVTQFSLQHNHIHLIIEAESNEILTAGMRSITITFAKGLQKGKVQIERYHLHVLKTLREVRNAVKYVMFNSQKHEKGTCVDEFSFVCKKQVKEFVKETGSWLRVARFSDWLPDVPGSYLLKRALV